MTSSGAYLDAYIAAMNTSAGIDAFSVRAIKSVAFTAAILTCAASASVPEIGSESVARKTSTTRAMKPSSLVARSLLPRERRRRDSSRSLTPRSPHPRSSATGAHRRARFLTARQLALQDVVHDEPLHAFEVT